MRIIAVCVECDLKDCNITDEKGNKIFSDATTADCYARRHEKEKHLGAITVTLHDLAEHLKLKAKKEGKEAK